MQLLHPGRFYWFDDGVGTGNDPFFTNFDRLIFDVTKEILLICRTEVPWRVMTALKFYMVPA